MLHGAALRSYFLRWDIERRKHGLQCLCKPLNKRSTLLGGDNDWQQGSLADSENHLRSTNADQVRAPVTQHGVRLTGIRHWIGVKSVQQLSGASEGEHASRYVIFVSRRVSLLVTRRMRMRLTRSNRLPTHTSTAYAGEACRYSILRILYVLLRSGGVLLRFARRTYDVLMPNFAQALKQEIARIARKEVREDIAALRKASTAYRSDIASLKRAVKDLNAQLRLAKKAGARAAPAPAVKRVANRPGRKRVFNAERLKAKRLSLGLSQAQMAQLLGISSLSQWKWESGQVTPRSSMLEKYFDVMRMGKREALTQIAAK
jgi:DNA-binding transcriptional regulator YiaG